MCVHTQLLSRVQLFVMLDTKCVSGHYGPARLLSLFMGLSRQEYWSRSPFPTLGDLFYTGIEPASFVCPALATWEAKMTIRDLEYCINLVDKAEAGF